MYFFEKKKKKVFFVKRNPCCLHVGNIKQRLLFFLLYVKQEESKFLPQPYWRTVITHALAS